MNPLEAAPVLPGETLAGKYRVERILGKGGMGIVVAARHLELEERVAIKFLLGERAPVAVERFVREARAAAKVKNEHVCRVYDVGRLESGEPYMVLEHLEGEDLRLKLEREEKLSIEEATSYVIEACAALAEAHALGIIHRDLKPANMFLAERADGSTCVKVLDFGISKVPSTSDMTSTAVMMGSPLYMSPEQIASSRSVDARSDIWSLGIVLFELVTGAPPFVADTMVQLSVQIREGKPPSLAELLPDAPDGFDAIVQRCLAKEQADRYSSVKELALALAKFARPEAAQLANRIGGATRQRAHSDPALVATAREGPNQRALRVATPPNRTPPAAEAAEAPPPTPSSEKAFGRATFDPLHTTTRAGGSRRPRWLLPALAISILAAIGFVATRRNSAPHEAPAAATTALATADVITAPPVASTSPSTMAEKPNEPPTPSATTVASAHAAPRVVHAKTAAAASSAAPAIPPAPPAASPAEAVTTKPEPSTPDPAGTRKKRSLDRNDPY